MQCPLCGELKMEVVDTRAAPRNTIRRRRECAACKHRWTTMERTERDETRVKPIPCDSIGCSQTAKTQRSRYCFKHEREWASQRRVIWRKSLARQDRECKNPECRKIFRSTSSARICPDCLPAYKRWIRRNAAKRRAAQRALNATA